MAKMMRIKVLDPGAAREQLIAATSLLDLSEVAAQGIETARSLSLLQAVDESRAAEDYKATIETLAAIITDYFYSVLNFVENAQQLAERGQQA